MQKQTNKRITLPVELHLMFSAVEGMNPHFTDEEFEAQGGPWPAEVLGERGRAPCTWLLARPHRRSIPKGTHFAPQASTLVRGLGVLSLPSVHHRIERYILERTQVAKDTAGVHAEEEMQHCEGPRTTTAKLPFSHSVSHVSFSPFNVTHLYVANCKPSVNHDAYSLILLTKSIFPCRISKHKLLEHTGGKNNLLAFFFPPANIILPLAKVHNSFLASQLLSLQCQLMPTECFSLFLVS